MAPLAMFALCLVGVTSGQVNTEAMRRSDISLGWHASLAGDVGYVAGNSNLLKLESSARLDRSTTRGRSFLVGEFQQGRQDDG